MDWEVVGSGVGYGIKYLIYIWNIDTDMKIYRYATCYVVKVYHL